MCAFRRKVISCFCLIKTIKFWTGVCVAIDGLDSRYNGYVIVFKQILVILLPSVWSTYIYPPPPLEEGRAHCFAAVCLSVCRSTNSFRSFSSRRMSILKRRFIIIVSRSSSIIGTVLYKHLDYWELKFVHDNWRSCFVPSAVLMSCQPLSECSLHIDNVHCRYLLVSSEIHNYSVTVCVFF